jgi:hypothetical protein
LTLPPVFVLVVGLFFVQPKLSGLDTVHLTCLLSSWSTLKFEPEPAVMRGVMGEVYTKLPLFDDKVWCAVFLGRLGTIGGVAVGLNCMSIDLTSPPTFRTILSQIDSSLNLSLL